MDILFTSKLSWGIEGKCTYQDSPLNLFNVVVTRLHFKESTIGISIARALKNLRAKQWEVSMQTLAHT